ncbi:hypothetical protein SISSUDRAFT_1065528 [Sistotremastrum suecicum HHB10207 ss-3]|uniref:Uncharacterized protein n=1 Tax=Sistotremastrum suecicum HHB10207 ss-3 TaxID=1314776 RepID=A0A165ZD39_9AGAM|nr:hypothetical protein SISSUDRAFT_1065528 [Sistotremastrum suecicum HHB10207 ss-3]
MGKCWTFPSIEFVLALRRFPPHVQSLFRRHPFFFPAPFYCEVAPARNAAANHTSTPATPVIFPYEQHERSMSLLDLNDSSEIREEDEEEKEQ